MEKGRGIHKGDRGEVREGEKSGEHGNRTVLPLPHRPRTGELKRTYLKKITNTKCEMLQSRWDRRVRFGNKDVTGGSVEERERKTVCNELKGRTVKADNSFQEIWL